MRIGGTGLVTRELKNSSVKENSNSISEMSELLAVRSSGTVCVKIIAISESLRSRNGWQYRKLDVKDNSMSADILIPESKFSDWELQPQDCVTCSVTSNGVDNSGRLSFFFQDYTGPFDAAALMFDLQRQLHERKSSSEKMKTGETVYQISAREAKSLLELIKLWSEEGKPQHYTKWCQMHQIVATNLYYMGLVKRTASMSGHYYPTQEALDFFLGKTGFPKKKVFVRGKDGKHQLVATDSDMRSFSDYLSDYANRDAAITEYKEALSAYKSKHGTPNA
jgi:hypothetical protein